MSAKPDGGPAYPTSFKDVNSGMWLRDWFAGQALVPLIDSGNYDVSSHADQVAKQAYALADAMIAERAKP